MKFSDIKTFTYIGNKVIVDGVELEIQTPLDSEFEAVQYHKGRPILEEPLMEEVEGEKYQYALDEWAEAKYMVENPIVPVLTEEQLGTQVRGQRDSMLDEVVDKMNPMRWETFTEVQKQAWRDYRQALLDVPQQDGFPETVEWPVPPWEEEVING